MEIYRLMGKMFFIEKVLSFLIDKPVWKCEVMDKLMLGKYLD